MDWQLVASYFTVKSTDSFAACFRFHSLEQNGENTIYKSGAPFIAQLLSYTVPLNRKQKRKTQFVERFATFHKHVLPYFLPVKWISLCSATYILSSNLKIDALYKMICV